VCCASAGADRPECGICADPAYVVIPIHIHRWPVLEVHSQLELKSTCSFLSRNIRTALQPVCEGVLVGRRARLPLSALQQTADKLKNDTGKGNGTH
jgi:hypothetical protein